MKSEAEWARLLALRLTAEELSELHEFLDYHSTEFLITEIAKFDSRNYPDKYSQVEEKK